MKIVFDNTAYRDAAIAQVDRACDAARLRVVEDPVRVWEYEKSQQQAQAYADAGFTGDVPRYVAAWQKAKWRQNWTAQQAAQDILATAAPWEEALIAIRELRLGVKEDLRASTTQADIDSILAGFFGKLTTMMQGVQ
jgi:hypothetical protein